MKSIRVIADNGGGLTLQITHGRRRWQHTYEGSSYEGCGRRCAEDIRGADSVDDYDGNQLDEGIEWLAPTREEIRNGGYAIVSPDDLLDLARLDDDEISGAGLLALVRAYAGLAGDA